VCAPSPAIFFCSAEALDRATYRCSLALSQLVFSWWIQQTISTQARLRLVNLFVLRSSPSPPTLPVVGAASRVHCWFSGHRTARSNKFFSLPQDVPGQFARLDCAFNVHAVFVPSFRRCLVHSLMRLSLPAARCSSVLVTVRRRLRPFMAAQPQASSQER
jgi:hypothetical protein